MGVRSRVCGVGCEEELGVRVSGVRSRVCGVGCEEESGVRSWV